jgi:hypothetical protein
MASAPLHIAVKSRREIFLMDLLLPMSSASLLAALEASENMRKAVDRHRTFQERGRRRPAQGEAAMPNFPKASSKTSPDSREQAHEKEWLKEI